MCGFRRIYLRGGGGGKGLGYCTAFLLHLSCLLLCFHILYCILSLLSSSSPPVVLIRTLYFSSPPVCLEDEQSLSEPAMYFPRTAKWLVGFKRKYHLSENAFNHLTKKIR